jgi:SM-20-related protein
VFTAPAFLDVFTCLRIQRAMDAGLVEPAEILEKGTQAADDVRRASSVEIAADLVALVERRLDAIRETIAGFFNVPLTDREGPGFLRYREGGFYRPHRDRGIDPAWPDAARRQVAVVVFLNSSLDAAARGEFSGGALQLFVDVEPLDVAPARGLLVAFPADVLHQVVSVTGGTRDTIVDWYY